MDAHRGWLCWTVPLVVSLSSVTPAGGAEDKLKPEDIKALFHAKSAEVDAKGGVRLVYDFSEAAQLRDFEGKITPGPRGPAISGRTGVVWLAPYFDGDLQMEVKLETNGRDLGIFLHVQPEVDEGYVFLWPELSADTILAKYRGGRKPEVIERGRLPHRNKGRFSIVVTRSGDELIVKVGDNVAVRAKDRSYASGRLGLEGDIVLSRLEVRGRIHRRWCEKARKGAPAGADDKEFFRRVGVAADFKLRVAAPPWPESFKKETAHYEVSTNADQKLADTYGRCAEAMYDLYTSVFPDPEKTARRSRIYLFKTRDEFLAFGAPPTVLGFYLPSTRAIYCYDHVDARMTERVLLHEGFHQYIHLLIDFPPIWFNEGMAQYFETATLKGGTFTLGATGLPLAQLAGLMSGGRICSLPDFLLLDVKGFQDPRRVGENYAYAWGLCHFFLHHGSRGYRKLLVDYFREVHQRTQNAEAVRKVFGKLRWSAIEKEWIAHVRKLYEAE